MMSSTFILGSSDPKGSWKMICMSRRRWRISRWLAASRSRSWKRTLPEVGSMRRRTRRPSLLFLIPIPRQGRGFLLDLCRGRRRRRHGLRLWRRPRIKMRRGGRLLLGCEFQLAARSCLKPTSGAKAPVLPGGCGTTEVVPFHVRGGGLRSCSPHSCCWHRSCSCGRSTSGTLAPARSNNHACTGVGLLAINWRSTN